MEIGCGLFFFFVAPNLIGFNPALRLPLLIARFVLSDIFAIGNQGVCVIKKVRFKLNLVKSQFLILF
jgi:hypothetical protein